MREYKLVLLNMSAHFSKQKNIADAEKALNDTASKGWILKQIYGVPDLSGTLLAVFYKEK